MAFGPFFVFSSDLTLSFSFKQLFWALQQNKSGILVGKPYKRKGGKDLARSEISGGVNLWNETERDQQRCACTIHFPFRAACYSAAHRKHAGTLPLSLITVTGLLLSLSSCMLGNITVPHYKHYTPQLHVHVQPWRSCFLTLFEPTKIIVILLQIVPGLLTMLQLVSRQLYKKK